MQPKSHSARYVWLGPALVASFAIAACASDEKQSNHAQPTTPDNGPDLNVGGGAMDVASTVPQTCAEAVTSRSYLGCDFWPTVTLNAVWSIFDFAVVVANVGTAPAEVVVTGPAGGVFKATVPPKGLSNIYLPWVPALKGADADECGRPEDVQASVVAPASAFHLTSTVPVIVNQFSALEFRGAGGPPGKDWSQCPGLQTCVYPNGAKSRSGCFSFSNDAAILLPSSALTGNYRVTTATPTPAEQFIAITATQDATNVTLRLSATANILGGGAIKAAGAGETVSLQLNAGDVAQVVSVIPAALGAVSADLSGSLVQADRPVQVIAGSPCAGLPARAADGDPTSCDHLEESVLPAETVGKHYVVPQPTGVFGRPVPHIVRLYGNVDGTTLTYPGGAPPLAPTSLDAGQVVDLGQVARDFEVVASNEILVSTFLLSAAVADATDFVGRGDPSQSQAVTVDQFRTDYVFLAPDDYDLNFVDVIMPLAAEVTLDGQALPESPRAIGGGDFGVARVRLGAGDHGAHSLISNKPVGLQVLGYGSYTSYAYPGGLNLKAIAPPPK